MEDQTAILANAMHQDPFELVMRGYNRRQVDEYVTRTRDQVRDLESRLAHALDGVEKSRRELAGVKDQFASRPAHEEVSERLSQILRLAAEEAEQERAKAEGEITQLRETAEEEIGTLVQQAREEADQILSSAREEADAALNSARQESQRLLDSSREEAEHVVAEATDHAERVRRQAEHRASVVNGVLTDRLAALTDAHGLAVRRLAEIHGTLADLLHGEAEAGPLASAVSFRDGADAEQPADGAVVVESPIPAAGEELGDAAAAEQDWVGEVEPASDEVVGLLVEAGPAEIADEEPAEEDDLDPAAGSAAHVIDLTAVEEPERQPSR